MSTDSLPSDSSQPAPRPRRERRVVPMPGAVGRTLPHNLEAEEFLLACLMLDGRETMPRVLTAKLGADSFYDTKHADVFTAIVDLHKAGHDTSVDLVAQRLQETQVLERVGGYAFLSQISKRVPTLVQFPYFLQKVREQWILRQTIRAAVKVSEQCYAYAGEPLHELLAPSATWFQTALQRARLGDRALVETMREDIAAIAADVAARVAGTADRSGWIATGFPEFDTDNGLGMLGCTDEDHNVLIGGGSSAGKSVLMRQWAGMALRRGQRVLVYTLETSRRGFLRSLAAAWSGVNLRTLAQLPADKHRAFEAALAELSELADKRLEVIEPRDAAGLDTIEGVAAHLRAYCARHGVPHLVVMDYLQILGTEKKGLQTREAVVAHVAHSWQRLQRELGHVAVAGAQLNEASLAAARTVKRDKDGKVIHEPPNRGALRESQALYHDADVVIFLHKPVEDRCGRDQTPPDISEPEMWLCVDKRRNGPLGRATVVFEKRFGRFRPIETSSGSAAASGAVRPVAPRVGGGGVTVPAAGVRTPRAAWRAKA